MAEVNETPEPVAADDAQPTDQAVESPSVEVTDPAADDATETPVIEPRVFAGKYKTVEELETSYQASNAENSRMASELAVLRRAPATVKADTTPKYGQEQLETWKESRIREVAQNEAQAAQLSSAGDFQGAQKHAQAAQESARQIRLIDGELRKLDINAAMQSTTRQSAEKSLMADANTIIRQHASDLVPGTTLYNKAAEFLSGYGAMGMDTESALVQAQSVAMAAQVLGLSSKKGEQAARKDLNKSINANLKAATVTGGGKSVKSAAAPDFEKMSDADFNKYKKSRGWD